MIHSPHFPPFHTVHATFTPHDVPSISQYYQIGITFKAKLLCHRQLPLADLFFSDKILIILEAMNFYTYDYFLWYWLVAVPPFSITENIIGSATTSPTTKAAYYSLYTTYCRLPCSDNLIFTYALRCLLWAWQLGNACNTARYFIWMIFTLPHCHLVKTFCTFLCSRTIGPYIRGFVRRFRHSHHMHFIVPRPIGYTVHLWTVFVLLSQITVSLSRLHRAFDKISFLKMLIGVLGEAFWGVTSSFHFSDYQFS